MLPWTWPVFTLLKKRRSMSMLEFLAIKEFDGKLRTNESQRTAIGDLATLTAAAGKDMYFGTAKISGTEAGSGVSVFELSINGTVVETARVQVSSTDSFEYEFKNKAHKVTTGQIIKIEWTVEGDTVTAEGYIECWEENTGVSPQIPSI